MESDETLVINGIVIEDNIDVICLPRLFGQPIELGGEMR
ncbi:MAG: hypothetical protein UT64_C0032G0016 [Candidatus Falkowbacteria bacterium GW2011_GWF2_39_8]|uniref:Uncharacterized protein n=1 Tax=Candidatus Falkowbacteria bacterium GW2011_GWF2_39_8 TaxID=1618642 RepID=A0A0G0T3T6_9BACT|nr:MAG: hypothetical protein UT64_C0032G0016 [Candidatus Falkowbacteria bacterium GW2011_GWF2_39_8]